MAVDIRILLRGMNDYSQVLTRHAVDLEQEFHQLHGVWAAFSQTYEGSEQTISEITGNELSKRSMNTFIIHIKFVIC